MESAGDAKREVLSPNSSLRGEGDTESDGILSASTLVLLDSRRGGRGATGANCAGFAVGTAF